MPGSTGEMGGSTAISIDGWRATVDTNLTGAFLGAKHQIPAMLERGGGSLIFTSTFVGYTAGMPRMAAYAASQSRADRPHPGAGCRIRPERRPRQRIAAWAAPTRRPQPSRRRKCAAFVEGLHALKRVARPEEIAWSALYLASEASSFTTGTALLADGGVSINRT